MDGGLALHEDVVDNGVIAPSAYHCRAPRPHKEVALHQCAAVAIIEVHGHHVHEGSGLLDDPPYIREPVVPDDGPAHSEVAPGIDGAGIAGLVLVDCRDGAILALASTPGFDLTDIRTRYEELADPKRTPGRPLHDHAAEGWEPPGSTVKPLIGLAAMMEGVYRPGESVTTRGYMDMWQGKRVLRDHRPYDSGGTYTMRTALKHSVNTFFATLAQRVGPEKLCAWHRRFGFGVNNALDVGWQEPGILPTPATHRPWLPSDTWRMGIGQYCSASPLQLVTIAACIGNGGTIVRPYLNRDLAGRTQADHLDIPRAVLAELRAGMEAVTEPGGTASHLVLGGPAKGLRVAAKTGTSEWGSAAMRAAGQAPDHAWLIGYAPADAPTVAFAIFIRCGMSGGRGCSGVAKRVLEVWFERHPPG
uniref:Penicillin-binding protein transpeptidase domain-containing protein n=1 Tax=Desulfobacca acetoxidans TaxID=60893 RepID=A0A7V4LC21_9BACT